jgi:hypothetical protein
MLPLVAEEGGCVMARRVELVAAGLAGSIGLLWLVYAVHTVQALGSGIGATGQPFFHFNTWAATGLLLLSALLVFGLAGGAYLHVLFGDGRGWLVLCGCTVLFIVDLATFEFAGWWLLPYPPEMEAATLGWSVFIVPSVLPVLEVLITTFGIAAVLASLSPIEGEALDGQTIPFFSKLS